jgi:hypothetical protein
MVDANKTMQSDVAKVMSSRKMGNQLRFHSHSNSYNSHQKTQRPESMTNDFQSFAAVTHQQKA